MVVDGHGVVEHHHIAEPEAPEARGIDHCGCGGVGHVGTGEHGVVVVEGDDLAWLAWVEFFGVSQERESDVRRSKRMKQDFSTGRVILS